MNKLFLLSSKYFFIGQLIEIVLIITIYAVYKKFLRQRIRNRMSKNTRFNLTMMGWSH